jgi:hypothetical protein
MKTNHHNIDYQYVHLNFNWTWIRDKQIILRGNEDSGVLIIADEDGNMIKMWGFERII